jgi:rod shape-determining protein MreD
MFFYIFAVIFLLIDLSVLGHFQLYSVRPNLILFLITIFSFYFNFDKSKVILFCLFCGFLKDISGVEQFGTNILIFSILGVILSYVSSKFLRYNWLFIIPLFVVATISYYILYVLVRNFFFGKGISLFDIPYNILILELFYSLVLFFIFVKPIKKCVIDKLS